MRTGDFIDQALGVRGGQPPYNWQAMGLPGKLQSRPWGSVWGVLESDTREVPPVSLTVCDVRGFTAGKMVPIRIESATERLPSLGFTHLDTGYYVEPTSLGRSEFCLIAGGYFPVGYHPSPQRNRWLRILGTRHGLPIDPDIASANWPAGRVHLDTYLMQRFEVTNDEYAEFVRDASHPAPPDWEEDRPVKGTGRQPVADVTRQDAEAYCRYKTERARQMGLDIIYRLPSNWQWEKAAKGPWLADGDPCRLDSAGRVYPWGDQWMDNNCNDQVAQVGGIVDVEHYAGGASPWGVCDLVGNVREWVDGGQYVGEDTLAAHIRGGAYDDPGPLWGLTFFFYGIGMYVPFEYEIGFRCVVEFDAGSHPAQALVPLGNDKFMDADGQCRRIGAFKMARFAVSNEEYAQFEPSHTYPMGEGGRPVVNVSHGQATSFCKWKGQQDGCCYRLPTFEQWLRAYRGTEGRNYPWGNEYSRYRCNSMESGWGRPVDVWALWQGATPEGVYNLCGNTFEWLYRDYSGGGSLKRDCRSFGAPPFTRLDTALHGSDEIGFRYVAQ